MGRTLLLLAAGAALGAVGTYGWCLMDGRGCRPAREGGGSPTASLAPAASVLPSIRVRPAG